MDDLIENPVNGKKYGFDLLVKKEIEVKEIYVPKEVDYIGNWQGFQYPMGHLILDKTICGCGFTEFCLSNNIPTILCSPRKTLLNNKKGQHLEENVYYFKNEYSTEIYDCETIDKIDEDKKKDFLIGIKNDLSEWMDVNYGIRLYNRSYTAAPKILVTYDSLHHVLEALGKTRAAQFSIVVDEFQSIFLDAAFKSETEMDFVEYLKECPNVLYLSATPMLEKYLCYLDYFKDLDFYKLIWNSSRIENVRIERRFTTKIHEVLIDFVDRYRRGDYPTKVIDEKEYKSEELVIFVNSVRSICSIIKKCKLKPEETNIICAKTEDNKRKIKKSLGKDTVHEIGDVPLKGEQHKMFTLCTRTTYLGSDFYSPSAYTIICSDANIKTLTVDISLDLPQIVGRQRLQSNVFRNEILFLYKTTKKNSMLSITSGEYQEMLDWMEEKTKTLLDGYDKMTVVEKKEWSKKAANVKDLYINDFLGVSKKTGFATYNYLMRIAKQRAYDVTREEYQDHVSIRKCIEEREGQHVEDYSKDLDGRFTEEGAMIKAFREEFNSISNSREKLKILCNFVLINKDLYERNKDRFITLDYQYYMDVLGPEKIRALDYEESKIKAHLGINSAVKTVKDEILKLFDIGKVYSKAEIKDKFNIFYENNNINKTAKSTDILEYFEVSDTMVKNKETGKRDACYKILKIKE